MLRELGGLSYHELGRALGVSHSAVESLLFRARQQVRSLVAGAAPVALRDQVAQVIPGFDPGSAGLVARAATLPIALKLAGAAVSVGVIATGTGSVRSSSPASPAAAPRQDAVVRIAPPVRHVAQPIAREDAHVVRPSVRRASRRRGQEHEIEAEHAGSAAQAEHVEQVSSVATSSEGSGPGPAPAQPAQVEQSHEGPGDAGGQTATTEGHSGSDHSDGDGSEGGSGHSGPG